MTEAIKQANTLVCDITSAKSVQAMITLIVTIGLMSMVVMGRDVPEYMLYAWFAMIGVYMEMPGKKLSPIE